MISKKIGLYVCFIWAMTGIKSLSFSIDGVDLIIFSFDRPLQLEALLRSIDTNIIGVASTSIIYRTSNQRFDAGYQVLQKTYPSLHWIQQGKTPTLDFKPLTMQALHDGKSSYIFFAVDDIIVKNKVNLLECIQFLEQTEAYGFYLRLGTHLDYCFALSAHQPLPPLRQIAPRIVSWTFGCASGDWAYPNTVDMTIYRKAMVINMLSSLSFTNPNTMEKEWAKREGLVWRNVGLCFTDSIALNIPLNIVQTCEQNNPQLTRWSTTELLAIFEEGKRIDLEPLQGIKNHSCHTDCEIVFINQ